MTNQSESQVLLELDGSIGPVEQLWQMFVRDHTDSNFSEMQLHNAKLIYYMAAGCMSELMTQTMKKDPSLNLMVIVSQAIAKDLSQYFHGNPSPQSNH